MDSNKSSSAPPEFYESEAVFAFKELKPVLSSLGNRNFLGLEIGCGTGYLMSKVLDEYSEGEIIGLEPGNTGFEIVNSYNESLYKGNILNLKYEDFITEEKFDLIYSVNVIEHVEEWKSFIDFVVSHLRKNGTCLILCPNYGFPYESHFGLPVLWNKNITFGFFKSRIEAFEEEKNAIGLWESLNFIKKKEISLYLNQLEEEISYYYDEKIIRTMIDRLDNDLEFSERQKSISFISRLVKSLNIDKLFSLNLFSRYSPYIKLIITKK